MEIFGMGPLELILVFVVALIVFGPGKLPEIAAGLGKAVREFRKATSDLSRGVMEDLESAGPKGSDSPSKDKGQEAR